MDGWMGWTDIEIMFAVFSSNGCLHIGHGKEGWTNDGWTDGQMDGWTNGWMNGMDGHALLTTLLDIMYLIFTSNGRSHIGHGKDGWTNEGLTDGRMDGWMGWMDLLSYYRWNYDFDIHQQWSFAYQSWKRWMKKTRMWVHWRFGTNDTSCLINTITNVKSTK